MNDREKTTLIEAICLHGQPDTWGSRTSLNPAQLLVQDVEALITLFCMEGIAGYYFCTDGMNSIGIVAQLRAIGDDVSADMIQKINNELFQGGAPPTTPDAMNELFDKNDLFAVLEKVQAELDDNRIRGRLAEYVDLHLDELGEGIDIERAKTYMDQLIKQAYGD